MNEQAKACEDGKPAARTRDPSPKPRGSLHLRAREQTRIRSRHELKLLLRRTEVLPAPDRTIIRQHLGQGLPLELLAKINGKSIAGMRRRIRAIKRRLFDPRYLAATTYGQSLPAGVREVILAYYVRHQSLRSCAAEYQMTLHAVRQALIAGRAQLQLCGGDEW